MSSRRTLAVLLCAGACMAALGGQAVAGPSSPDAGRAVFAEKQCGRCHLPRGEQGVGPALEDIRRPQGEMELAGRLWNHLPAMFASLTGKGAGWPQISMTEMGDLMAYLQADPARDPEPDLFRWQAMHGLSGLWAVGLICGNPVGRDGSYAWQTGQNFRSRGAGGFTAPGSSACLIAGP